MLPNSKNRPVGFQAWRVVALAIAVLLLAPLAHAQFSELPMNKEPGAVYDSDVPNEKPGPAPRRDISGIWEPAHSLADDVGADGAKASPADGKPEHEPPFTPDGRKAYLANKPNTAIARSLPRRATIRCPAAIRKDSRASLFTISAPAGSCRIKTTW